MWLRSRGGEPKADAAAKAATATSAASKSTPARDTPAQRQLRKRVAQIDARLPQLQADLAAIELRLAAPDLYAKGPDEATRLGQQQLALRKESETLEAEWLQLYDALQTTY
ncbi:hypothetical protein [Chiayiivirga sp.]|uniref:hypothetical protein n=1 Tax=Chiayiivirga sp. TaxID=2041042 RepID=UPI003DA88099